MFELLHIVANPMPIFSLIMNCIR